MKTWPGIIFQQQLHYVLMVLTFSFLHRCSLKLNTFKQSNTRKLPLAIYHRNILTVYLCLHNIYQRNFNYKIYRAKQLKELHQRSVLDASVVVWAQLIVL